MMQQQKGSVLILALLVTALLTALVAGLGLRSSYRLRASQDSHALQSIDADQDIMYAHAMKQLLHHQLTLPYHDSQITQHRKTVLWIQAVSSSCDDILSHHVRGKQSRSFLVTMASQAGDLYRSSQRCLRLGGKGESQHWAVRWYHQNLNTSGKEESP